MNKALTPVMFLLIIGSIFLMQSGFVFFLLATLPSLVAYYSDRTPRKPAFKIVCASNLAATLPALAPMMRASLHFKHYDISMILRDPSVWMIAYSGAAAGWCMIYLCRLIASFIVTISFEYNVMSLESMQKRLVEEWGEKLIENKPAKVDSE